MTNPATEPKLIDECPDYRFWIDQFVRDCESGHYELAAIDWRRAVRAAAEYRASLVRQEGERVQ